MLLTKALFICACVIFYQANAKATNNVNTRPEKLQVMSGIDSLLNYGTDAAEPRCNCNVAGCNCPAAAPICCPYGQCCYLDYPICGDDGRCYQ